eukprot:8406568-Ditylum_brightwellii.AAC.1
MKEYQKEDYFDAARSVLLQRGWKAFHKGIEQADVGALIGTWATVSVGDAMHVEGKKIMGKLQCWCDNLVWHHPTNQVEETSSKEADCVTMLGLWMNLLLSVGKLIT